jgi:predicted ATPase
MPPRPDPRVGGPAPFHDALDRRLGDAQELLAPVCAGFTEGFDVPDLQDANALLGELR